MSEELTKAADVQNKSEEYALTHAVMAVRAILEEKKKREHDMVLKIEKLSLINNPNSLTDEDYEQKWQQFLGRDHRRIVIIVDYLDTLSIEGARTILGESGYIEIVVSNMLKAEKHRETLRSIIGHELGHLMLHFEELLLLQQKTIGSRGITDDKKEAEANKFSKELLRLRDEQLTKTYGVQKKTYSTIRPKR